MKRLHWKMVVSLLRDRTGILTFWDERFILGMSGLRYRRLTPKQAQKLEQLAAITGFDSET